MKPFRLWRGIWLLQRARWHMRRADKLMSRIEGMELARYSAAPLSVVTAIAAHRAAVDVDEDTYDLIAVARGANAKKAAKAAASATLAVEIGAFQRFIAEPCRTAADIQAKVDYLLNGTVGMRDELYNNLLSGFYSPDDGPLLHEVFLRSLVLDETNRFDIGTDHASHACACPHARGAA